MRRFSHMRTLPGKKGFSLIEMMVAVTVLVILLGILFTITNTVAKTVVNTSVKIDTFAAARSAFDLMSQKLSQSTLNTYWDYDNPISPTVYERQSDLQFLIRQNVQKSGYGHEVYFVTPSMYSTDVTLRSTDGLLNACGFFVAYGPDTSFRPGTLPATNRYRYRLMQGLEPTENLSVYGSAAHPWPSAPSGTNALSASYWSGTYWPAMATYWSGQYWVGYSIGNLGTGAPNTNDTPLVNNVIALIVWPHLSSVEDATGNKLTANYTYDSQSGAMPTSGTQPITANQLPPTVQVTMIVISESSAARLNMGATPPTVIETALTGKFVKSNYTDYQADLASVSASLSTAHISFEIMNTSVTMKESKWSDNSQ